MVEMTQYVNETINVSISFHKLQNNHILLMLYQPLIVDITTNFLQCEYTCTCSKCDSVFSILFCVYESS